MPASRRLERVAELLKREISEIIRRELTVEQVEGYERDGFVCPVDAFSAEQARAWRNRLESFEAAQGQKMTRGHKIGRAHV